MACFEAGFGILNRMKTIMFPVVIVLQSIKMIGLFVIKFV